MEARAGRKRLTILMNTTLTARRLITDLEEINYPTVRVNGGQIVEILAGEPNDSTETLAAPFFDIHVHGARTYDFMAATQPEIDEVGQFLAGHGVGHYLATTVTGPVDPTFAALERLADAIEAAERDPGVAPMALPVGIHLEGPFISHIKRGVHPESFILEPDSALFDRFQQAARGHIRLITIAPELPHALELIAKATSDGVRVSLGHSNATAAETRAAIAAGATSATHLFNAMRVINHREPGIIGTILDENSVYAEAICDGVHLDPAIVRLWLKAKGEHRAILMTDGMSATGMPDGRYMLGGMEVEVHEGVCLSGKTLAGSVLTMDQAVANLQQFTGSPLATAVRLASRNPAEMIGMPHLAAVRTGAAANFNIFNEAGQRTGSYFHGQRV